MRVTGFLGEMMVPAMYNVRLAASPINWCNDDLVDLGDQYSFSHIVQDMSKLGFVGTEMGRKYPREPERLKAALAQHGLVLSSAWTTVHLANAKNRALQLQRYEEHILFLKQMGCQHVVTAEGGASVHWDEDGDRDAVIPFTDAQWRHVAEGLCAAGALCRKHGLRLAYHPHYGTNVQSPEDLDRLLQMTDPAYVDLLFDTGHIVLGGGDPLAVLQRHRERIQYIHLKDVRREVMHRMRHEGFSFLDGVRAGVFTVPGDGMIDFAPLLHMLAESDYQGWMVIEAEQDPGLADPVTYMKKALSYLEIMESSPLRPGSIRT